MTRGADLSRVSTGALEALRGALAFAHLRAPIDRAALVGLGLHHQLDELVHAFAGLSSAACLAILDAVLAERRLRRPPPELVWSGPESPAATARDTAVVLRSLFESAQRSVILAGYRFDHARDVLSPVHAVMRDHGVDARFFVDVPQLDRDTDPDTHLAAHLGRFVEENWPFGPPRPRIYYDVRALRPGPPFCSLHAKCVVVDGARAFVSSANFTRRGQERNIEVGVLLEDPAFASLLASQWLGLIEERMVAEYGR